MARYPLLIVREASQRGQRQLSASVPDLAGQMGVRSSLNWHARRGRPALRLLLKVADPRRADPWHLAEIGGDLGGLIEIARRLELARPFRRGNRTVPPQEAQA